MVPTATARFRRGRWSIGEIARLRDLYGLRSEGAIARKLGRPKHSVRRMAERIFRGPRRVGPWSAEDLLSLKRYLGVSPVETIARILRRTPEEVRAKIATLGKRSRGGRWTREDVAQLKLLYGSRTEEDLSRILGRSAEAIRRQAAILQLSKDKAFLRKTGEANTRMPRWTAAEEQALRRLYPSRSNLAIAKILKRSVKAVVSKAHDLRLSKAKKRLRAMGRENVSLRSDR